MRRRVNGWVILAGISSTVLLAACAQVAPMVLPRLAERTAPLVRFQPASVSVVEPTAETRALLAEATPTVRTRPAATPTPNIRANLQIAVARRGPIRETIQLGGRVQAVQEVPLAFAIRGTIDSVAVEAHQVVPAGQLLVTLDSTDAVKQLSDVRAELEITRARIDQLNARSDQVRVQKATDAQARLDADARRAEATQQRIADATARAQEQLRQAQVNLDKVKAGAPAADRLAAEGAVATARGNLARAETDAARLRSGPTAAERRAAEQAVATAQIALKKTQTDHDKLLLPPEASVIATARKEVAAAEADVERAGSKDTSPNAPKVSESERQARQVAADFALKAANEHLSTLLKGPDKATIELANMAVESARADLASAQAHLQELTAPPTQEQLTAADNAVQVAQLALGAAQARLAEVNSHPTAEELRLAQKAVADAQLALERAGEAVDDGPSAAAGSAPSTAQDSEPTLVDRLTLQRTLNQQLAEVRSLEQQTAASQLRAPFTGIVASVQVKPGDAVEPRRAVLVFASDAPPQIAFDVPENYASRLAAGISVTVQPEASTAQRSGALIRLADSSTGATRSGVVQVDWSDDPPALGASVQVVATVGEKRDALLIPQRAVRASGDRRSVEILDGQTRRIVDVKLGVASGTEVEVVSGLADGQEIIMPA